MNDDRRTYSYDDLFPERWLHAPDLDGKTVTLTITAAYAEFIENPKKHKKDDPGELCGVLSFKGTKREYVLSKQNAWILKALWGKDPEAYLGKRITLSPVPDSSGFTEHGTRILFTGSPDIENDLSLNLPGGKHVTFKRTAVGKQKVDEPSVDQVTGEVADDDIGFDEDAPHPASSTESGQNGDAMPDSDSVAAEALSDEDGDIPGMDAEAYAATREPAPTLLHPVKVSATQVAAIGRLRKSSGIYDAEFAALLDSYGADAVGELTKDKAEFVIAALKEREAAS